jgi:HK97 family phage portal protein
VSIFRREYRDVYGNPTFNPFENPAVPLQSVAFDSVYGLLGRQNNASGEPVTQDRALAIPTVWRCIGLLATVIAGCPLKVYKDTGKKLIRIPALDAGNFSTTYTPFELWELVVAHICLWGNAYVRKVRNGSDQIIDLIPVTPALVKAKLDDDGHKVFEVRHVGPDGAYLNGGKPEILTTWEIMHLPGLGYDGIRGLSPLAVAAQTYGTAIAADKLAARFFSQGTQLTGVINVKAPLSSQQQADDIKTRWMQRNAGVAHSAGVAVLDAETSFQPLTIPPDQLQFLESREWQASELARMYGIPPHLIGDESKSTSWGSGIEQQNIGFVAYTIAGWTVRISQRVTREVVTTRGQYATYDLTELMRGSTNERFTAYAQAIQWGWMTRNEARIKEDMEPITGLDEPLTPLNMKAGSSQTEQVNPLVTPLSPSALPPGSGKQQLQDESQ